MVLQLISLSERHDGTVVTIKKKDNGYYMLVISNIDDKNILNKTEEQLITLAQENSGAYYHFNNKTYNNIDLEAEMHITI